MERMNPLTKLAAAAALSAASWLTTNLVVAAALASLVLLGLLVVRPLRLGGFLKTAGPMLALVTAAWAVSRHLGGMELSEAVTFGAVFATRFFVTTAAFFVVVETTSPGSLLAACSAARVPGRVALVLALVIGLIPILREAHRTITDAQRCRGLELDRGPLPTRLRRALSSGVPLLVHTFYVAENLSTALSLQGFDPKTRRSTWRRTGLLTVQQSMKEDR